MSIKKIILILCALLTLVACKPATIDEESVSEFSIISPSGAPALALLDFVDNDNITYEIVDGSDVLAAEFASGEKDFIIAPVNLGVNLINNGAEYTMVSVLTWGNLYLVGTSEHLNVATVAAFGEAAVPGRVLGVLSEVFAGVNIEYFNSVQEVSAALLADQYEAAVLAEPYLTMTRNQWSQNHENELYEIYDIQDLYAQETGVSSYPQAALFVRNDLLSDDVNNVMEFASSMQRSIANYNEDSNALSTRIDSVDLSALGFANADLIKDAYSRMALDFVFAYDCLDELEEFLALFDIELSSTSYIK